ncbi:MAG: 5-formyltetrahydrofolate cyclo-ligase [Bacillaceae bacterium]|nr:5-formyltetrahydrofolate cyclo-ligase [Bacillaceae bacterium]
MMSKDEIRHRIWERMTEEKVGRFPFPLTNRIPNFKGAEKAASLFADQTVYQDAEVIKVNPDAPQLPLRQRVLADGKVLLIPTPRLRAGFIMIRPEWIPAGEERKAASIKHMKTYGKEISLRDLPKIDLIVAGSVAVHRDGRRIGKGEGYSDREYAILRELGQSAMPVVTTVHSYQVVEDDLPRAEFDLTLDWIITEKEVIETHTPYRKPEGILWNQVSGEEREAMPVLQEIWDITHAEN